MKRIELIKDDKGKTDWLLIGLIIAIIISIFYIVATEKHCDYTLIKNNATMKVCNDARMCVVLPDCSGNNPECEFKKENCHRWWEKRK